MTRCPDCWRRAPGGTQRRRDSVALTERPTKAPISSTERSSTYRRINTSRCIADSPRNSSTIRAGSSPSRSASSSARFLRAHTERQSSLFAAHSTIVIDQLVSGNANHPRHRIDLGATIPYRRHHRGERLLGQSSASARSPRTARHRYMEKLHRRRGRKTQRRRPVPHFAFDDGVVLPARSALRTKRRPCPGAIIARWSTYVAIFVLLRGDAASRQSAFCRLHPTGAS